MFSLFSLSLLFQPAAGSLSKYLLEFELPVNSSTLSSSPHLSHLIDYVFTPPKFTTIKEGVDNVEGKPFQKGRQGEIWRAKRVVDNIDGDSDDDTQFVLKKLYLDTSPSLIDAGRREIHHGERVNNYYVENEPGLPTNNKRRIVRFVEHFFTKEQEKTFLWLVYEAHGTSLRELIYTQKIMDGGGVMMVPSDLWRQLRYSASASTDVAIADHNNHDHDHAHHHSKDHEKETFTRKSPAARLLQKVLWQILQGAAVLQELGIKHRDIKPSNILCKVSIPLARNQA